MVVAMWYFVSTPLHAQTSGGQASTLLEVQALRQEVGQLRDMVERQQYELRKIQRSLQKNNGAAVNTQPVGVLSNTVNQQPSSNFAVNSLPIESNGSNNKLSNTTLPSVNSNNVVGVIDASVAPTQTSSVVTTADNATQSNGRTYPPVVEIAVGNPVNETVPAVQPTVQADSRFATNPQVISQATDQIGIQTVQPISNSVDIATAPAFNAGGISVVDIKPIETISAGSIVSIPSSNTVTEPPKNVVTTTNSGVVNAQQKFNVISENDYYQQGFGLLKKSKHSEAVTVFQQQIKSYPKGPLADDAYYWVAESMYVNRKLDISKENYKAIVQGYPNSERLPDAMLKLAYIEQEQGNIIESRILLQEIMQFHPKSDAALSAKNRLSELN